MLRGLADRSSGVALRLAYDFWHALQEHKKVGAASKLLGIDTLGYPSFDNSQGKTLFILGSGESVEDLSPTSWDFISHHHSIGLNAWPLHPFVPNEYAFEPFDPASVEYVQLFSRVLHEDRILTSRPTLLLFRPQRSIDAERYLLIPERLRKSAKMYGRTVPSTHSKSRLRGEIKLLHSLIRKRVMPDSLVVDLGATVIRMVSLGIMRGYTRIVLVGVDLNGGQYFWERNPARLADRGLSSFSPGFVRPIHETMATGTKAFVLTEVLASLQQILAQQGGSLYAGSTSSRLAHDLPVFFWPSKN